MQIQVTTYKELDKWCRAFVGGSFSLLFLVGRHGLGKTHTISKLIADEQAKARRKTKKKARVKTKPIDPERDGDLSPADHIPEPLWIEGGSVSAFQLYMTLWKHLHETVIMDDVDEVYRKRDCVQLLKALCQTKPVKTVGWTTYNKTLIQMEIPDKFRTRSRVCIIANKWQTISQNVGSLVSRGVMLDFQPSPQETYRYVTKNKIITDKEVLGFVRPHLNLMDALDIRDLGNAVTAKKAKLSWKPALAESLGIRDVLLVRDLEGRRFPSTEARVTEFCLQTGLSRPMYFKAASRLDSLKKKKVEEFIA